MSRPNRLSLIVPVLMLLPLLLHAEGGLYPFEKPGDSLAVRGVVERYLQYPDGEALPADTIAALTSDEFAGRLEKGFGMPVRFPTRMPWRFEAVRATGPEGTTAMAAIAVAADSIGSFGTLSIDWVFLLRRSTAGAWRITALRRQNKIEDAVAELKNLDTATLYPPSLKPRIVRETGRVLLSNEQLRANFAANRERLAALAGSFNRRDSLWMLGRIDRSASQINQYGIAWGDAAQEIPDEARREFLAMLPESQREGISGTFHALDVMRAHATDSVRAIARRVRIPYAHLDSLVNLMSDCRVAFVNARLPWKQAIQFTVAGRHDDALGYLYSPTGEMPFVSAEEYFYLEDLGGGWWIFRAT